MNSMRFSILIICLLGLGGVYAASCSSIPNPRRPTSETYSVDGTRLPLTDLRGGIQLFAPAGNIHIRSSTTAYLDKSYSVSAADLDTAMDIVARSTIRMLPVAGNQTLIRLEPPADCPFENLAADSLLALPPSRDIDLRTVNGVIDSSRYLARNAKLRTRDGSLLIGPVEEKLDFASVAGRVELLGQTHETKGRSNTGEIHIRALAPGSRFDLESESGSSTIYISTALPVQVIYRTKTGALRILLENKDSSAIQRRTILRENAWIERRVRVLGAAPIAKPCLVVLKTVSGDLTLTRPSTPHPIPR